MPPGIFVRFLATNWCSLVDVAGVNFQLCGHGGGGGGGGGACDPLEPPTPPNRPGFKRS